MKWSNLTKPKLFWRHNKLNSQTFHHTWHSSHSCCLDSVSGFNSINPSAECSVFVNQSANSVIWPSWSSQCCRLFRSLDSNAAVCLWSASHRSLDVSSCSLSFICPGAAVESNVLLVLSSSSLMRLCSVVCRFSRSCSGNNYKVVHDNFIVERMISS